MINITIISVQYQSLYGRPMHTSGCLSTRQEIIMQDKTDGSIPEDTPSLAREENHKFDLDLRVELGHRLREILIRKRLKQRELATLLAIQQPEVSHLFNGHFTRFTVDKLIQLFDRVGWVVKFQIYPRQTD